MKKTELIRFLQPLIHKPEELRSFLIHNSNLPGPRANLELVFAMAEVYDNQDILKEWILNNEGKTDANDPVSFLSICSLVCLGKIYTRTKDKENIIILKKSASDPRWRIREAVAFGFQLIGENDVDELKKIFSTWISFSNNLEKRAILVSLAHPPILDENTSLFSFDITEIVLEDAIPDQDFETLRKALSFTISVFTAAYPDYGFNFMKRWIGKGKITDWIIKENLKKGRLIKKHSQRASELLNLF